MSYANDIGGEKSSADGFDGLEKFMLSHCRSTQTLHTRKQWIRLETFQILLKNKLFQLWFKKTCHECYPAENAFQEKKFSGKKKKIEKLKYLVVCTGLLHVCRLYVLMLLMSSKGRGTGGRTCHLVLVTWESFFLSLIKMETFLCKPGTFMLLVPLNLQNYLFPWSHSWETPLNKM